MSNIKLKKIILILEASPKGIKPLQLGKEVSEIKESLQRSRRGDEFKLEYQPAANPIDIQRAMRAYTPHIIHFCGHGMGHEGLILEDNLGNPNLVSGEALADLFKLFQAKHSGRLECVLLNACYSKVQAEVIGQYISSVIGMPQPITDRSAIQFSIAFYDELVTGETIESAYLMGRNAMQMDGVSSDELPILIQKSARLNNSSSRVEPEEVIQVPNLEMPEGIMAVNSPLYIVRSSDQKALRLIQQQGITIVIQGSPQTGKSSLMNRLIESVKNEKRVVILDFQTVFDFNALENYDRFFRQFCGALSDLLGLEDRVDEYWQRSGSAIRRCTRYVGGYILKTLESPLVIAIDEVERMFNTDFRDDFFGMLRYWDSLRVFQPLWKNLDLLITTYNEPFEFIRNKYQSPFNVGQLIELEDFSLTQMIELNKRHNNCFNHSEVRQLMKLLNGHPYLARRAFYSVSSYTITVKELFDNATTDHGIFGSHLRLHLRRLHDENELRQGFVQILRNSNCSNRQIVFRLEKQGLVRKVGKNFGPRCQLYAEYFRENLHE